MCIRDRRKDLVFTGRTLFGAMPPKGQELDDHYLGTIRQKVSAYMKHVNEELWRLGVTSKTQHNEACLLYTSTLIGKTGGDGIGGHILKALTSNNWFNPSEPVYSIGLVAVSYTHLNES